MKGLEKVRKVGFEVENRIFTVSFNPEKIGMEQMFFEIRKIGIKFKLPYEPSLLKK
ncbi:hypothetical protein [Desulfobacula sp.]|uniref:hypothetical protein n=1 Tax=Desulfobacula sp. TaxID=2593537 RepID=UPI001EB65844|nr:hypothetical protein [Desulfobacula sp.]